MKTSIKAVGLFVSVSVLLLTSAQPSTGTMSAARSKLFKTGGQSLPTPTINVTLQAFKEFRGYFTGTKWIQGGIQCDGDGEVIIVTPYGGPRSLDVISFPKQNPSQKSRLKLRQKGDDDCGMMKCYSTYVAPGSRFVIQESHYLDDEAFWTVQYHIGKGRKAEANMEDCRWLERSHVALLTEMRSIYVTESEAGELEYSSFNYREDPEEPSVKIKGGKQHLDKSKGIESFTFTNGEYTYEVNVSTSEKRPFAEVLVKKNGATIQKEHCLIYTYANRS